MRWVRTKRLLRALGAASGVLFGVLFFPADAWAWGPVAHVDIALQLLAGAAFLTPALHRLIRRGLV